MAQKLVTILLWGFITITLLIKGEINLEHAYVGMCMMLLAFGLLHKEAQIEALIERHLHGYTKSTWDFVCELRDILKRNPTVIPKEPTTAEEEKNDK